MMVSKRFIILATCSAFALPLAILFACNSAIDVAPDSKHTDTAIAVAQKTAVPTPTSVTVAPAPTVKSAKIMIAEWDELNGRCRGGSGDDARTWSACDARDALGEEIDSAGWCLGKIGEWVGDAKWHQCTEDSCARQPGGSC